MSTYMLNKNIMLLTKKSSQKSCNNQTQKKRVTSQLATTSISEFSKRVDSFHKKRFKTQSYNVEETKICNTDEKYQSSMNEQNMLHTDVYHRPQIRKLYFRQLVDSYFNKSYHSQLASDKIKNKSRQFDFINAKDINQLDYYSQIDRDNQENNKLSMTNSVQKIQKFKRVWTAGHTRNREKTVDKSIKMMTDTKKATDFNNKNINSFAKLNENFGPTISRFKLITQKNNKYIKQRVSSSSIKGKIAVNNDEFKIESNNNNSDLDNSFSATDQNDSEIIYQSVANDFRNKIKTKKLKDRTKNQKPLRNLGPKHTKSRTQKIEDILFQQNEQSNTDFSSELLISIVQNAINDNFPLDFGSWRVASILKNEFSTIYNLVKPNLTRDPKLSNIKLKFFNQTSESMKMLKINEKIRVYTVTRMWETLPRGVKNFSSNGLSAPLFSADVASLRHELFQFKKMQKVCDINHPSYAVYKTHKYQQLFESNCEQFKDIIIAVAKDLITMKGTLINNKISLQNLYRMGEKQIKIGDWSNAAINSKIVVAGKSVCFREEPVLTIKQKSNQSIGVKWMVSPELLPPQVIEALVGGHYNSIWQHDHCPEVWSLGIVIYQILTCIPVDMPEYCCVGHQLPKRGCFYDKQKQLSQILQLQQKIPGLVARWIRDEKGSKFFQKIDLTIINLMKQILQINPKLRPSPEDIVKRLNTPNV